MSREYYDIDYEFYIDDIYGLSTLAEQINFLNSASNYLISVINNEDVKHFFEIMNYLFTTKIKNDYVQNEIYIEQKNKKDNDGVCVVQIVYKKYN
jgi:hypothetical protein